jgi:hypothetical protein
MNEIYDIYRKIRTDCKTHLEVQNKMIKDYGYTWQEITEAKVAMEANEPNYWVDKTAQDWTGWTDKYCGSKSINNATPAQWDAIRPDMVNSPPHYTKGGIETIDYIQAKLSPEEYRGYLRGNLLKYASRLGEKDSDDAGKAAWYAQRLEML